MFRVMINLVVRWCILCFGARINTQGPNKACLCMLWVQQFTTNMMLSKLDFFLSKHKLLSLESSTYFECLLSCYVIHNTQINQCDSVPQELVLMFVTWRN